MTDYDIVIIGAGPGGMTAGIYAGRKNLKTAVFEKGLAGGYTALSPRIENYPGFVKIPGDELSKKMEEQMKLYITDFISDEIIEMNLDGEEKIVKTKNKTYTTKAIILGTGTKHRQLGAPGEKEYLGKGVFYCTICDAPLMKGKPVAVIGGGNSAVESAIYLASMCPKVYLVHRRDALRADEKVGNEVKNNENIEILWDSQIQEIKGQLLVDTLTVKNKKTEETKELSVNGVFIQVGEDANSQLAEKAGIELDEKKHIKVNALQETSAKGVYAVGDVCNTYAQTIIAAGHGATAALKAYDYITYGK